MVQRDFISHGRRIRLPWGFHVTADLVPLYEASDELQRSKLSPEARKRLAWLTYYERTKNASATCRHFGISRKTFYVWRKRYDPQKPLHPGRALPCSPKAAAAGDHASAGRAGGGLEEGS